MGFDELAALILLGAVAGTIAGCAGTGGGDDKSASEVGRTAGTVVEDQAIEMKAARALKDNKGLHERTHVNVTSYNTIVLVTGEAPNEQLRDQVVEAVRDVERVSKVYDEITIAAPSSLTSRTSDTLLTAKVKAQLFGSKDFDASRVKVVTEKGVVYLMGLIPRKQGDAASEIARRVGGVQRVVKLFEYTDE